MATINRRRFSVLAGAAMMAPHPASAAEEVVFASYGGGIEQFLRKSVIREFEKETGIKVTYVVGTALSLYSRVLATRARPEIDIYWANDLTHVAGKQMGLYGTVNPKIVTHLDDLVADARQADNIGVISNLASTGLQYNTDKFKQMGWAPPTSWLDLWDPKYKGRVALYSINVLYSQEFLGLMARLMGGDEKNIAPGLKKIRELKEMGQIAAIANTPAEMDNILAQGQAWITYNGGTRALTLKASGAPFEFITPKEGAISFNLYLDPIKGAPHPDALQKFIEFFLRPEIQTKMAEGIFYAPANRKATLHPDLAAVLPHGTAAVAALIRMNRSVMNQELDHWIEQWNRVIEIK
ncbi:MAG: ABC transporter substrate-binding protein [Acetobacteraceae bacterium]|nr:ABC transporter substrate-binding protein [Acetobacteraceae bacterium]MSP29394.1 ABC transporter substrate-binding protein [Acetobacteraceae bacterium]